MEKWYNGERSKEDWRGHEKKAKIYKTNFDNEYNKNEYEPYI